MSIYIIDIEFIYLFNVNFVMKRSDFMSSVDFDPNYLVQGVNDVRMQVDLYTFSVESSFI